MAGCGGAETPGDAGSEADLSTTMYERGAWRIIRESPRQGIRDMGVMSRVWHDGLELVVPGGVRVADVSLDPRREPRAAVARAAAPPGLWLMRTDVDPVPIAESSAWGDWFAEGDLYLTSEALVEVGSAHAEPLPHAPGTPLDVSPDRRTVLFHDLFASKSEVTLTLVDLDSGASRAIRISRADHPWLSDDTHCIPNTGACTLWKADHLDWRRQDGAWTVDLRATRREPPADRAPTP